MTQTASIEYYDSLENYGKINSNIHLIKSEQLTDDDLNIQSENAYKWKDLSSKAFIQYKGKGLHEEMLKDKNKLLVSAEIINSILKEIGNR